jgi:endo-1,4-beta-xylanase
MKSTSAAVTLASLGLAITACSAGSGSSTEGGTGGTGAQGAETGGAVGQPLGGGPAGGTVTGATGGQLASGGSTAGSGGTDATGGMPTGGAAVTGGTATGGAATGGTATGGAATGGAATGGAATGGTETGGVETGGVETGGAATGGELATGGGTAVGPDCSATMPTGGVTVDLTSWISGQAADGLSYGGWTNGNGGTVTYFPDAHAFAASWNNSENFLAHLGLDFDGSRSYSEYGTIIAEFVEEKHGEAGGFSMIGMYGWTHNPCVEWYIDEDSYHGLYGRGDVTATIDGATYYLRMNETTGTEGANACESGHTGPWIQMHSTREAPRQCGIITVSDHFDAWTAQGWSLGNLTSVHINVEVGGGVGSIDFPVANVTTSN